MSKIKLATISMGCDKNTCDTEKFLSAASPYCDFTDSNNAEYIFLNTCAFLKSARSEMKEYLTEFADKKIILAGCFQNLITEEFKKNHPQIIGFVNVKNNSDFLDEFLHIISQEKSSENPQMITTTPPSHAFVKIAEGCNRQCSFCLIPYLTGNYRSIPEQTILAQIENYVAIGIKEIILVAQDTGLYGHDLAEKSTLTKLLQKIEKLDGNFWVRILYLYPAGVTDELLTLINNSTKILPYFDFPLQHFSPKILADMNRPKQTDEVIEKIRKTIPDAVLRTTMMVAYPTETTEDFDFLCKKLEEKSIDHTSVFIYSSEPHTVAGKLKNEIPEEEKQRRELEILEIGYTNRQKFFEKIVHTTQTCLVDDIQDGVALCRSWHFAPSSIDGYIYADALPGTQIGDVMEIELTHTEYENIYGQII